MLHWSIYHRIWHILSFPGSSAGKTSACNAGNSSLIPGSRSSPGEGIGYPLQYSWASLMVQTVKNLSAMWETWVQSLCWKIAWRRAWLPIPIFLPGESPWTDSLAGYNLWGCIASDRDEWLSTALSYNMQSIILALRFLLLSPILQNFVYGIIIYSVSLHL